MSLTRFALAAALAALGPSVRAAEYFVFLGTHTESGGSKGIYRCKFDDQTGKLTEPELAAEMANPICLAIHPRGHYLYAVGESNDKDGGPVVAFALDPNTGALKKLNEHASGGPGPCHVAVHPDGNYLIVANAGGGSTAVFRLDDEGKIAARTGFAQDKGSGVVKGPQDRPQAYCAAFDPTGKKALTADLGIDRIKVFAFDAKTGSLADETEKDVTAVPGSGPRRFVLARRGEFLYFTGSLDSTINVVHFGPGGGATVQSLATIPAPVKGNAAVECALSPDGRSLYVSNCGKDNVAVFRVGMDGKLTAAGHITGDMKDPRGFALDPSGRWMLVASHEGGKVGVWGIDPATGAGKEASPIQSAKVGKCACVKFVRVGG
jgi:6-phosphogluconolactonase